jgi:outer membrane autotransporter protein
VSSLPTFVGIELDNYVALANGMVWTPYARIAWVHEFDPNREATASLITLPGAAFTVDGPRAARDAARIDAGSKLAISRTVSLFDSFDGEFSTRSRMFAGKGGVQIDW